jgi:dTDP-4-dehydrorhamnose 3,5-epimerase
VADLRVVPFEALPEVKLVETPRYIDERGYFVENYNRRDFVAAGIDVEFVQDNQSLSKTKGTLRGLHFQAHPFAQAKLVRVVRGRILDVVVDIRRGSPSFGRHVSVELSASEGRQIFVPVGFAHGLVTLEDETEVAYKTSNFYSAAHDRGLLWNDPHLGIDWRVDMAAVTLSDKDRRHPGLEELPHYFDYAVEAHRS